MKKLKYLAKAEKKKIYNKNTINIKIKKPF